MCWLVLLLVDVFEVIKCECGLVDMNDLECGVLVLLVDVNIVGWV